MLRLISAKYVLQLDMHKARVMYEKRLVENFVSRKDPGFFRYIHSLSGNLQHQFILPDPPQSFPDNSICSIDISPEDAFEVLTSLQTDKTMGGH
uniref:Uncharacterized protein n=1 Tax=Amphimedon queenslandica TaxID=400682 RepID=A0A1X7TGH3_AMPQE